MITALVQSRNDIDLPWPAGALLDAIGFNTRVRGRVEAYLKAQGIERLSLRELMDLFLPSADAPVTDLRDLWAKTPIFDQPRFSWMLHDYALLALTEADFGSAYRTEWALRMCKLMLHQLRLLRTPDGRGPRRPRQRKNASA